MIKKLFQKLFVASVMAVTPMTYQQGWEKANKEGGDLIVEVGATWCPGCHNLQKRLERLDVNYAYVDAETDPPKVVAPLMRDAPTTIPQLIRFRKVDGEWTRKVKIGDFIEPAMPSEQTPSGDNQLKEWLK